MIFPFHRPVARALFACALFVTATILALTYSSPVGAVPDLTPANHLPDATHSAATLQGDLELVRLEESGGGGEITLQHEVSPTTSPVPYGEVVSYTVRLKRTGGSGAFESEVRDRIPFPLHLAGDVEVTLLAGNASSLKARVDIRRDGSGGDLATFVRWKGSLAPNSEIQIRFPVHVHPICGSESTRSFDAVATTLKPDGSQLSETAAISASCPTFRVSDVGVVQELVEEGVDDGAARALSGWEEGVAAYRVARVRTTFTNRAQAPVTLLAFARLEQVENPTAILGEWPMGRISLAPGENISGTMALIPACSNRTKCNLRVLETALADIPAENETDLQLRRTVRFAVIPADIPSFSLDRLEPGQIGENPVNFPIRPWDVGDAPDSSNHTTGAAAQMPAYANGTIGRFPTVFDPATDPGGAQGPAFARPRFLHLGQRVEVEPDGDLGPAPLNINPPANNADSDADDDGLLLSSLTLNDCQKATFQVEVFVHPQTLAFFQVNEISEIYLNSWADTDRSGDWGGVVPCPGGTAVEHIVIDQPVPVSTLSAGINLVNVTSTGPVSWPASMAQQPFWMRLLVSERQSNKTLTSGAISFGDGRGYATPGRLGEVEDYFLVPTVDFATRIEGRAQYDPNLLDRVRSMDTLFEKRNIYLISLRNRGQQTPDSVELDFQLPDGERLTRVEVPGYIGCLTCTRVLRQDAAMIRLNLNLQEIRLRGLDPRNLNLTIETMGWTGCLTCTIAAELPTARVTVLTSDEVASNNSASVVSKGEFRPVFGWATEAGLPLRREGTTRDGTIYLSGLGRPGAAIELSVWKAPANVSVNQRTIADHCDISDPDCPVTHVIVTPDVNGVWSETITGLKDGRYTITAIYRGAPAQSRIGAEVVRVNVDSSLLFDSLLLTPSAGANANYYVDLGFFLGEWPENVALVPGESYQVRLRVKPGVEPNLLLPAERAGSAQIALNDDDGDNVWQGSFTWAGPTRGQVANPELVLLMRTASTEVAYTGSVNDAGSGFVRDLVSGQPIEGATVLLAEEREASGGEIVYVPWDGARYGGVNPLLSPSSGAFRFRPPQGSYRLLVEKPGYQSFRTQAFAVESGALLESTISLTPKTGAADVTIVIDDGGYSESALQIRPGTTVRWYNADGADHRVAVLEGARASAATRFDSGLLGPGESYSYTFSESGAFTYGDEAGGLGTATITVDPNAPVVGTTLLYMPAILSP